MGSKISKTKNHKKHTNKMIEVVMISLLAILLFSLPFSRGLFFEKEMMITYMLSFLLFGLYTIIKIKSKEKITLQSPFGYIAVALVIAYILPIIFFQWANLRGAIGLILSHINYLIIYVMVSDYSKKIQYKMVILNTIIASGFITASIGILALAGYVDYRDAVLGASRIASTFQYPNTLAALMMTLFFIVTGLQNTQTKLWQKSIYGAIGYVMLITFIFTYSRSAWLLFPIFAIIYLILIPSKNRINTLFYYIAVGIPTIAILQPFMRYSEMDTEKKPMLLISLIIGLVIFTVIHISIQFIIKRLQEKHYKIIYILLGTMVAMATVFIVIAVNTTQPLVFDNTNHRANRVQQINRTIKDSHSESEYTLTIEVEDASLNEEDWPWRVRIHSSNEEGELSLIEEKVGSIDEQGMIEIPFTTERDTEDLIIYFRSQHPQTKTTFYEAKLYDHNDALIEDLKLSYKYIPEQLISRFNAIDASESSASTRIAYYRDGLNIYRHNIILGSGGGAWNEMYPGYQSQPYYSTQAHNYFLQTIIETGTIGLAILIFFIMTLVLMLMKSLKNKDAMNITLVIAIVSMLGHSFLDFNFSYLSMPIILWALVGLLNTDGINIDLKLYKKFKTIQISPVIPLIIIAIMFIFTLSLYRGYSIGIEAENTRRATEERIELYQRAISRDPFRAEYYVELGKLLMTSEARELGLSDLSTIESYYEKAVRYAPYNASHMQQLASYYISWGQFDNGLEYIEQSIEHAPLRQSTYNVKSDAYETVGSYLIQNGDVQEGLEMYEKVLEVADDLSTVNKGVREKIVLNDETLSRIERTKYYIQNHDQPQALGRIGDIVYLSYMDIDVDGDGQLDNWWTWNRVDGNLQTQLVDNGVEVKNSGDDLGLFISPRFELEPNQSYGLELHIEGNMNEDFSQVVVYSRNGTTTQYSSRPISEASDEERITYIFETTDDITPGDQEIRLYHYGDTDKSYQVNKVMIYKVDE
ncbi:O-antigen ligase-like membrane protein [Natranaerovirga hydrolytica]|uniref:O-antigen ligase-like membrane protein n=1 Tax=Natranaerovirga hydrolytica TaxID=680378 RepID=A0A4R1MJZ8_9FIRM|nr:O-antigen ligase family protein [Natranaerovirga hydrolytica]TCK93128.1 O-antigen ligase-like membrane protein [Natranaerovirga hydrolytica]